MTFIDFFVSAYYSEKPIHTVKKIIQTCDKRYKKARNEYDAMISILGVTEVANYIERRIKYKRYEYIKTYIK